MIDGGESVKKKVIAFVFKMYEVLQVHSHIFPADAE